MRSKYRKLKYFYQKPFPGGFVIFQVNLKLHSQTKKWRNKKDVINVHVMSTGQRKNLSSGQDTLTTEL